jgi:type II secretory pathway pseudopilin PulG
MGQQQLLLLVLGIIIVGIAIAVGITSMSSNRSETNRRAVINDLLNLGRKAQSYYRTPAQMGGGSQNFQGFYVSAIDTGNANGSYSAVASTAPTGTNYVPGNTTPISSSTLTVYIIGCGTEKGNNRSTPVKCYVEIKPDNMQTYILN